MQVKKAGVVFYEMEITQQHIDSGFAIGAHSTTGSRFKLLLFEQAKDGQWELLVQVPDLLLLYMPSGIGAIPLASTRLAVFSTQKHNSM